MDRFIVLAARRSGVTLLLDSLSSHPQIQCYKEVFRTRQKFRYFQIDKKHSHFYKFRSASLKRQIDYILRRKQLLDAFLMELYTPADGIKATIARLAYLQARKYPEIVELALENDIGIIHLVRENSLKTIASNISARKRNTHHSTSKVEPVAIQLSPSKLRKSLTRLTKQIENYRAVLAGKRHLEVSYESFVAHRDTETRRILNFLGVDPSVPLTSDLIKLNPDSLEDILENYDQVAQALKRTVFEKYLTM